MARSVTYSVVPRINPREKDEAPKYYAQAQARGDMNIREMSERIQSACTVNKADVYAVLVALEDVIAESLQNGEIVRLGELCTLQVRSVARVPSPRRTTTCPSSRSHASTSVPAWCSPMPSPS